jgi:hypothetical protein
MDRAIYQFKIIPLKRLNSSDVKKGSVQSLLAAYKAIPIGDVFTISGLISEF